MKKIIIIPRGGLCNRMRAIASGVFIAQYYKPEQIEIYWNKSNECYCNFKDLFSINENGCLEKNIKVIENHSFLYKVGVYNSLYQKIQIILGKKLRTIIFDQCINEFNYHRNGNIFKIINNKSNAICLCSCHSMAQHYPLHLLFKPVSIIANSIQQITKQFKHTIGLHIRATDHTIAKTNSPIEKFIKRIDYEISINKDVTFFLATDDINIKQRILKKYKERIITRNNILNRCSLEGMYDAVIDLWCLSYTQKIIGSYGSSYTELAAELGNISLEFAK